MSLYEKSKQEVIRLSVQVRALQDEVKFLRAIIAQYESELMHQPIESQIAFIEAQVEALYASHNQANFTNG